MICSTIYCRTVVPPAAQDRWVVRHINGDHARCAFDPALVVLAFWDHDDDLPAIRRDRYLFVDPSVAAVAASDLICL